MEHATPELHAQNVAAVQAAIRDMENGDTGQPAKKVIEELRDELDVRINERHARERAHASRPRQAVSRDATSGDSSSIPEQDLTL
jgi:hypothetical protein